MKKIALLLVVTFLMIGVCGCMGVSTSKSEKNAINDIKNYLSQKYGAVFSYVSVGNEDWLSKSKSYVFADEVNRRFVVRDIGGYMTDNYASALYDYVASESITSTLGADVKLFINTESNFFNAGRKFDNYSDYLIKCPTFDVAIYVLGSCDYDKIANSLKDLLSDCCAAVVIYTVDTDVYTTISEDNRNVVVLFSESFWLENNSLSEKSWGE